MFHFTTFLMKVPKGLFTASWSILGGINYMAINSFSEKYLNKLVINTQLNYCINMYYRICQVF